MYLKAIQDPFLPSYLSLSYFGEILQKECELKIETDQMSASFDAPHHPTSSRSNICKVPSIHRLPSAARPPLLDHDTALVVDEVYLRVIMQYGYMVK